MIVYTCMFCFFIVYGLILWIWLKEDVQIWEVLTYVYICLWQSLIVLRWPCAADRMLQSLLTQVWSEWYYWLVTILKYSCIIAKSLAWYFNVSCLLRGEDSCNPRFDQSWKSWPLVPVTSSNWEWATAASSSHTYAGWTCHTCRLPLSHLCRLNQSHLRAAPVTPLQAEPVTPAGCPCHTSAGWTSHTCGLPLSHLCRLNQSHLRAAPVTPLQAEPVTPAGCPCHTSAGWTSHTCGLPLSHICRLNLLHLCRLNPLHTNQCLCGTGIQTAESVIQDCPAGKCQRSKLLARGSGGPGAAVGTDSSTEKDCRLCFWCWTIWAWPIRMQKYNMPGYSWLHHLYNLS